MKECTCAKDCCYKGTCGCPRPVFEIEPMPEDVAMLKFNYGGVSTWYDFTNLVQKKQTDTILKVVPKDRSLVYNAERHIDTITSKQLGSIMHIADIGDVDIANLEDNSIFVYQKNSDCTHGCEGINNSWIAWNAFDHQATSVQTIMGFDENGAPKAVSPPSNADQYYLFGWNAENKGSWLQLPKFGTDRETVQVRMDKNTKQLGWIE